MKKIAISALISVLSLASFAHAESIPCAAQVRAQAAEFVRQSDDFKNEDPGHTIGIYSIQLTEVGNGIVDAQVLYGSAREGSDGAAEMDLTITNNASCSDFTINPSK